MRIRACVFAAIASCVVVSSASAAPLLTNAGEAFVTGVIGSPSSFTLVVDKNTPTLNTFWLTLEGIQGPTLLLAEATVANTTYLLGAFSPWEFDRNVVVSGGFGTPGTYYVDDPAAREALLLNLTTNTSFQQSGPWAWSVDSVVGIRIGLGDLTLLAGPGDPFISGSATAGGQYGSGSGVNILGQAGTTDFSIGRLEAYAVSVPEPSTVFLAGVGACLGVFLRSRTKNRHQQR